LCVGAETATGCFGCTHARPPAMKLEKTAERAAARKLPHALNASNRFARRRATRANLPCRTEPCCETSAAALRPGCPTASP
jgi:hypothetical protein